MKLNTNFHYNLNVDYETETDCENHGCKDDVICRCSTIIDAKILSVDMNSVVGKIYNIYFDNSASTKRDNKINSVLFGTGKEIDIYTIDRILRSNRIWESDKWEINIIHGYYGEEINDVSIVNSTREKIENELDEAFKIESLTDRVNFLLKLEYGYNLPELNGCDYKIEDVKKEDIIFGSDGQYRKIKTENLDHYGKAKYYGIRGIVMRISDNKFRLIDGYHRVYSGDGVLRVLIANKND